MAFKATGRKLPVNLVLVCEGEEEIASPHFGEIVNSPDVFPHMKNCVGVMLPDASQDTDGSVQVAAGAKGVIELELVSDGATWGRGPRKDIHSSLEAQVDSPSWHLVQALNTLVEKDGHTPAVEGFFEKVQPLSEAQKKMVLAYAKSVPEATIKAEFGVDHWVHDLNWQDSLLRLFSQPTINIEGLVGGYTGPGGKTVLPHRAVAKIDMRLVPDMTAAAVVATFGKLGSTPLVVPRNPGSWPGYRFTSPPLSLPAGDFGLGHGTGAHAPDEYYLIDSKNPKIKGLDGAAASFVEFLYAIA